MSDRDFEIGGKKFKLNKIDAFRQFHIVRRLAPLLGELVPAIAQISQQLKSGGGDQSEEAKLAQVALIAAPLMHGLSKLTDVDADKVLFGLLSSVEMQQEAGNWARVATDSNLMFQNLELPLMLQVAGRAFMYNLSSFFSGLPRVS